MAHKNYDPQRVIIIFNALQIKGYAEGEFIKAGRYNKAFKLSTGAGGDTVRVRDRNITGSAVITLQALSPTNKFLQAFLDADLESDDGITAEFQMLDGNSNTLIHAGTAWIENPADVARGADNPNIEWTIVMADMEIRNG